MSITKTSPEWLGCSACIHYQKGGRCKAFPANIPIMFASGDTPHTMVVPGQAGQYVYVPRET